MVCRFIQIQDLGSVSTLVKETNFLGFSNGFRPGTYTCGDICLTDRRLPGCRDFISAINAARYVFTGYENAVSRNIEPTVMDALHVGADVDQPVGTAASGRGIKLGGVMLAMDAKTAACMNFHRSTPWRRQVS